MIEVIIFLRLDYCLTLELRTNAIGVRSLRLSQHFQRHGLCPLGRCQLGLRRRRRCWWCLQGEGEISALHLAGFRLPGIRPNYCISRVSDPSQHSYNMLVCLVSLVRLVHCASHMKRGVDGLAARESVCPSGEGSGRNIHCTQVRVGSASKQKGMDWSSLHLLGHLITRRRLGTGKAASKRC